MVRAGPRFVPSSLSWTFLIPEFAWPVTVGSEAKAEPSTPAERIAPEVGAVSAAVGGVVSGAATVTVAVFVAAPELLVAVKV